MTHNYCDVCRRKCRATNMVEHLRADLRFAGLMEYTTPLWKSWHLCDDCKGDIFYMILAVRDTMHGTDASITTEDFTRHAYALNERINARRVRS